MFTGGDSNGMLLESGAVTDAVPAWDTWVGDAPTLPLRGRTFMRFDLSTIPAGATIVGASLRVIQEDVVGAPYTTLGPNLYVDHVLLGDAPDAGDYRGNTLQERLAIVSSSPALGERIVDVTAAVEVDRAQGRNTSDFRFRFDQEGTSGSSTQQVWLADPDFGASADEEPTLTITYVR